MIVRQCEQVYQRAARAGLRVGCTVVHGFHARVDERACAHRARLERNVQIAAVQPPAAQLFARLLDGLDFCMVQCVFLCFPSVASASDNFAVADNHRADRHFALVRRLLRQFECGLHVFFLFGHKFLRFSRADALSPAQILHLSGALFRAVQPAAPTGRSYPPLVQFSLLLRAFPRTSAI